VVREDLFVIRRFAQINADLLGIIDKQRRARGV
jgi:hypothetical protein